MTFFTSKSAINTRKAWIAKAVEETTTEASAQKDRHIVYEDYPVRNYVIGLTGCSAIACLVIVVFFTNNNVIQMYRLGDLAPDFAIAGIIILAVLIPLLYNYLQRLANSMFIVSEEGIDERRLGDSGQRSIRLIQWNEVSKVWTGQSRQGYRNVQVGIKSNHGEIAIWPYWINFQYLAEKMLRLASKAEMSQHAIDILKWKASEVDKSVPKSSISQSRKNVNVSPNKFWKRRSGRIAIWSIGIAASIAILMIVTASNVNLYFAAAAYADTSASPPAGFQFIRVYVEMQDKNQNQDMPVGPSSFELKTNTGASYKWDSELRNNLPSDLSNGRIYSFDLGFEIPIAEYASTLTFHYGPFNIYSDTTSCQ